MTSGERQALQDLMAEELLRNTMLHDLRGNATALMGWQSLVEPQGQKAAAGLERSVEAFVATIQLFSRRPVPSRHAVAHLQEIGESLGISVSGEEGYLCVCPRRLEAALSLAAPSRIEVHKASDGRMRVRLLGLGAAGLALLAVPHSAEIVEAVAQPSRALGVCLFKEVVRGVRGEYEISGDKSELCLILSPVLDSDA